MDINEFKESVMPWQGIMFATAVRSALSADDAADAVQEAFIALWRCRKRLDTIDNLKLYCLRTIRNVVVDFARRRHATIPFESLTAEPTAPPQSSGMDTENISRLLEALPESQQTVMRMCLFEQLDNKEIAAATGLSEANVRQLLCRARKFLRTRFKQ